MSEIEKLEKELAAANRNLLYWIEAATAANALVLELTKKLSLADEYALDCYAKGSYMTFAEWLGDKDL